MVRFINHQCLRSRKLHPERLQTSGPAILAVTHLSHLDPFVVSVNTKSAIHWMTRLEFYRNRPARFLLANNLTFPVNRRGNCLGTMRYALKLLQAGEVVGIFPEGGVAVGDKAAIRGGPIKLGACFIAQYAQAPITPVVVVVVGTHKLNCVPPWLPHRRGHIWIAAGAPILPKALPPWRERRQQRQAMGQQLSEAFQHGYQELLEQTDLREEDVP
ncbi:MAG: 1-acyl-sn-glycerol-3-phosphate acyltransferase [Spartobacteria bacterium]|nr:1-acyl-sn-glycerol-3-phosphate acyltransferase [Spartobacteria bacterium]